MTNTTSKGSTVPGVHFGISVMPLADTQSPLELQVYVSERLENKICILCLIFVKT